MVFVAFVLVAVVFVVYDILVQRRNNKVLTNAAKYNSIVTQLFPGNLRNMVIDPKKQKDKNNVMNKKDKREDKMLPTREPSQLFDRPQSKNSETGVVAELYLETSICFADIAGFTAW